MKRLTTFLAALVLLSSLWPTVTVAQVSQQNMPANTVICRLAIPASGGPGQACPFSLLATQLFLQSNTSPFVTAAGNLSGSANLYASASGSDTNNFCTASGTPCTLKGACAVKSQFAIFLGSAININLADGTYSAVDANNAICTVNGNNGNGPILTNIVGDCTTPANVALSVPAGNIGILVQDLGEASISCLTITGGNNSTGLSAGQFTVLDINKVHFGTFGTSSVHVNLSDEASYNILGSGEFVDGSATTHWSMRSNAILSGSGGTTITTNVSFSDAFLDAKGAVFIDLSGWTLTNSSTVSGAAANLTGPGYMITPSNAACASALPGGAGCSLANGFQDSGHDASTYSGSQCFPDTGCWSSSGISAVAVSSGGGIKATTGIGYVTGNGAGGAVTQLTSRVTGVTLNLASGDITLFTAAGSASPATFTVSDSLVAATDTISIHEKSGTNLYEVFPTAVGTGTFNVTFFTTGGTTSDAPVFHFNVIKGANN